MTRTLATAVALASLMLLSAAPAYAVYGGSGAYQQENREDDYYGFQCNYSNACFGRCGPGCSTAFGTTVTTACQNHDACSRDYRCAGYSSASAHYYCLSGSRGLGKAAKSLIGYHWNNAKTYVKSAAQSVWATVGW
jgi:hypothetical protein